MASCGGLKPVTIEQDAQAPAFAQKWLDVLSKPIDPDAATATIIAWYQKVGYPAPKVVFVDSFWAMAIAATTIFHQSGRQPNPIPKAFSHLRQQLHNQLIEQLVSQSDWNSYSNSPIWLARHFSATLALEVFFADCEYWGYSDPAPEFLATQLEQFVGYLSGLLIQPPLYQWLRLANHERLLRQESAQHLNQLDRQLAQQLGMPLEQSVLEAPLGFPLIKPMWCGHITAAALYDYASTIGIQFDAEALFLFINAAWHVSWIAPFQDICIVSDRPQLIKRDRQGRLHGVGEPAIVFPDGFGVGYFYHGIELPQYCGAVHPNQWQAEWVLQERNAEIKRILIQEIGYARLCQELQAEELDSWREYTLLKLPIYDDFSQATQWRSPREFVEGVEATYLLKMICPSTGSIYALRVPPSVKSAREAATWVNWGTDPEWFTLET
jgi:hypothetical protein